MAETPDKNTPATDDRSPFRRFPWVQLVFCLACLTMAAWTWLRTGERPSPRRHGEHRGRREHSLAVLSVLSASVVRFAVDGLVVGAMGVFIFGLYLRRWVKERRAGG